MAQQTDLPSLSPSRGDLLRAWWRPWRVVLWFVGKLLPLAIPAGAMWLMHDTFVEVAETADFEMAAEEVAASGVMLDLFPLVIVVMIIAMLVTMMPRMGRV